MAKKSKASGDVKLSTIRAGHGLGSLSDVPKFRDQINAELGLSRNQRLRLIDQAFVLISELYVHLPLKDAMHSIDPLQRLRRLEQRVSDLSIVEFSSALMDIFKDLRDLHTNLSLPKPFGRQIAFLGILVERYFDGDESRWMVSKVASHLVTDAALVPGVEITHWNGMPMETAVWRNAEKEAGSNPAAQLARGLESLTLRHLRSSFIPDEDWVTVTYQTGGTTHETRLLWHIFESAAELASGSSNPTGLLRDLSTPLRYVIGVHEAGELLRSAKKSLFNSLAVREERRVKRYKGKVPNSTKHLKASSALPTSRPDEITAKIVTTTSGDFGYLRLWTFHMGDQNIDAFLNEFIRLLELMPSEGLILDVRGNGGGFVIAAEFLLQLLTHRHIKPEPSQFIATAGTLELTKSVDSMKPWHDSLRQAVSTGATYSASIPLSPEPLVNSVGQLYFGPIVLVTDAYCYSACDMFAAGFQDHEIGPVLGVDQTTGAGGANVLTHDDLKDSWTGGPLVSLPEGARMRVSLRRTLRVGSRAGQPVEDLGVTRDHPHKMTRNDLLNGNIDLLNAAGKLLAKGTPRKFGATLSTTGTSLNVTLSTENVESVDIYVDGRPAMKTASISDGTNTIQIDKPATGALVSIDGLDKGQIVASRKHLV